MRRAWRIARLVELCRQTRRPVHILHVSSAEELPLIIAAKRDGLPISAEVTPQHLTFSSDDYDRLGTLIQQNPPIRSAEDRAALAQEFAAFSEQKRLYDQVRFLTIDGVEVVRVPDADLGYLAFGWLTMGQLLSLPMLAAGLGMLLYAWKRGARSGNFA